MLTFPLLFLWSCYFLFNVIYLIYFVHLFHFAIFCKIEHLFTFCPYPSLLVSLCCLFSLPSLHCACCSYVNILLSLYLIILDSPPPHITLANVNFQLHFYKASGSLGNCRGRQPQLRNGPNQTEEEKRIKVPHAVCVCTAYPAYCNRCTFC